MAGIYIHIPFCRKACHYCDFHFSTSLANRSAMVKAICKELIERKSELTNQVIDTVYFGGGTPSVLLKTELQDILDTIKENYTLAIEIECTLEANPDDCSRQNLSDWLESGVNRLSIGVQSFDQRDLDWMNRSHDHHQATASILEAEKAGFRSINLDLIYGVPTMPSEVWELNVQQALSLPINHISAYSLTVEKGTALHHFVKTKKYPRLDEEKSASEFEYFLKEVENKGWEQYEISNYCKPGDYAKHNTNYWKQKPYIGVGPSAHSYQRGYRRWNVANNAKYLKATEIGEVLYNDEQLSNADQINELIMLGLRTKWGLDTNVLREELKYDIDQHVGTEIEDLEQNGKLTNIGGIITLTEKGKLIADYIAATLFTTE
ncbi:MAG: radical SAM family heme chaperone HemW [Bacteroidetes bacterium]|nr:radical SAM family heme chaperone HemW [Bacteroidota bacterium]